ncbi:hypothetical protein Xcel_3307 [Xylanimonas cellulosilytica DSM 15894]|uniref:DUF5808 domain-containing protein n=1 Tax=Xylanimonas cellulosilytica (strain DSM 15894 / JCM 12276 / CECT 5975 / KCTC 9989 / LMG 20990 / NBRC 107835 / XIL07) TaxID=446471 RepID=D1BRP1_XYLCX|nr:DUF5808 domain-containing protein [Xylanimonas cellulosilytica]ACZ32307.1 hypothetical protein Xcel_3307 [Xylanimonas cellulosilytica DSM 15894]
MARTKRDTLQNLLSLAMIALAVAAVVKELRTPQGERTWNGKVAAVVPYDFRMPTIARAKERLWDPESDTFVGPRVFGVGWTVNMGKLYRTVKDAVAAARS